MRPRPVALGGLHWHGDRSHESGPAFRQLDRDVSLDVVGSIFSTFPLPLYYQPYLEYQVAASPGGRPSRPMLTPSQNLHGFVVDDDSSTILFGKGFGPKQYQELFDVWINNFHN